MCLRALFVVSFLVIVGFSGCGGVSGENGSDPFNSDDPASSNTIRIGFFDQSGQFVEDEVGVSLAPVNGVFEISAGGSVGFNVALVDEDNQRITDAYLVEFTSNCVTAEQATLDTDVSTVNGEASSTYTDDGCAGSSGTKDQITARVVTTDDTLTATQEIDIRPEVIGAISFSSALPQNIMLQGSSDASQSKSIVTFFVSNDQAAPLANQVVEFNLTTEIGGLALSSQTGVTDTEGQVFVDVIAGSVPTAVRVNASVSSASGEVLTTQSDAISVTTGLPNQQSFSLATDIFNIEGNNIDGEVANITARLSDTFGNPVPDNTVVNFTSEAGQIESNCLTFEGACSVTWTSANPRATDTGIATILATAIGHETLFDSNGNNIYDQVDGEPIQDDSDSGRVVSQFTRTGFIDMAEAWRDDNENLIWDIGEIFLDYNSNQQYDEADGLFNGPQCGTPELCGQGVDASIHVRKSLPLIVSGSQAYIDVIYVSDVPLASNYQDSSDSVPAILSRGQVANFTVLIADKYGNVMPASTNIDITTNEGDISISSNTTVPNIFSKEPSIVTLTLENNLDDDSVSVTALISILVTTPSGAETSLQFSAQLQ